MMPYFDRFDICEAHYVFAMLWHGGATSKEYAKFSQLIRLGFKPAPSLNGPEDLEENGQAIYHNLVSKLMGAGMKGWARYQVRQTLFYERRVYMPGWESWPVFEPCQDYLIVAIGRN